MGDTARGTQRIESHPILAAPEKETIEFSWHGETLTAQQGECISSALFANGIHVFGHHPRDRSPQGIFCANGQCSQCMVIADGLAVKACMEPVRPGMQVEPLEGAPELPAIASVQRFTDIEEIAVECLIIGGGPAGLAAAVELGNAGVRVLLVDDKNRLGGKLVLQTHKFFGSIDEVHAGTRGIDIATLMEEEVRRHESVECWLNTNAVAVFSDQRVGLVRSGREYVLVRPDTILVATGAREKSLTFRGNTLPGVYGAGAFQTLVNRDLVRPSEKLFIVGGGNVGLIAGYHALQAGIQVVGLVEALPECGGYKVHKDKLVRMGVPIHTRHTVLSANGDEHVESVTVAAIDENWEVIPGSERSYACDTLLVAVGLDPCDEFYHKARAFGMNAFSAGDASEIAEASAAIFSGKIQGHQIAAALDRDVPEIPKEWERIEQILKSKPGPAEAEIIPEQEEGIAVVFHCDQDIPCNPCTSVCPNQAISTGDDIRGKPRFIGDEIGKVCNGCTKCVTICPGLAITLVDYRKDSEHPIVSLAHEFQKEDIQSGDTVTVLDTEGVALGQAEVAKVVAGKKMDRTLLLRLKAPKEIAKRIAGIQVQKPEVTEPMAHYVTRMSDDTIVCRCERVTAGEIRALIREGMRDVNEIKTVTRAGMGACGAKTCGSLVNFLFRQEGIAVEETTPNVDRPLFVEVPLGVFCGAETGTLNHGR
ncbi:MAG: FAD-dependent oxidoreductase [Lysobacterales bacterium]|jgi:NADPH-dependent 2,4-dienoyl-CoA reductase/sulfur reductase-like enzyme/Fe-S-cluster-containing hydrogenase component 2/bacterioferritin-associated ferredoxin